MAAYFIASLFSLAFTAFCLMAVSMGTRALKVYRQSFNEKAKLNLSELYLFIEPEKLFLLNLIAICVMALFAYLLSNSAAIAVAVSLLSVLVPHYAYRFLKKKRQEKFMRGLPEALGQIANALKAGLGFSQSVEGVVSVSKGPIQQEFDLFIREVRMGVEFSEALDKLHERMPILELNLVVSCIKISRETGGNLAENLERLADTLRRKLEMEGKIQALTSQGKAQGYVMTALPALLGLVIYQIEPEQMELLWTTWYGIGVIAVIVILQVIGFVFIRKIVNIDV